MISNLHVATKWINVSDGGHIENLAGLELLRRQCRLVILVDAEADPKHQFDGLATLTRLATLELNATIQIRLDDLQLNEQGVSRKHYALGRIRYSSSEQPDGILLYLKSSVTGDEDLPISEYRTKNARFPQQTTGDQFFDQDQFDAYRLLGIHIAEQTFTELLELTPAGFDVDGDCPLRTARCDEWLSDFARQSSGQEMTSSVGPNRPRLRLMGHVQMAINPQQRSAEQEKVPKLNNSQTLTPVQRTVVPT